MKILVAEVISLDCGWFLCVRICRERNLISILFGDDSKNDGFIEKKMVLIGSKISR